MKVVVTVKDKRDLELNKLKIESIRKIINEDVPIRYSKRTGSGVKKLSSLAGLFSIGGDSIEDSEYSLPIY